MTRPATNSGKHLHASDLRALAQLAMQATIGVTDIVEGVHQSVWRTFGVSGGGVGRTGGLTGAIYHSIRTLAQVLGTGAERVLPRLPPQLAGSDPEHATPQRDAFIAVVNGVMGDRLAANGNPLAIAMGMWHAGRRLDWTAPVAIPAPTRKVLLLVHGLCMNDRHWPPISPRASSRAVLQSDHARALADELGYTPVYLRYNSGRHISQNGQELAAQLQCLVDGWPVGVDEITVLAHSMGGLLVRSALHYGRLQGCGWPDRVRGVVFLGTPHHGAPLERAGNRVDSLLGSTPYTAPFARLGQLRSAGITDLRYGNVVDEDWQGHDRFRRKADSRRPVPLPQGIAFYCVAASTASRRSAIAERLIGDGLVPLPSALGQHTDAQRSLAFAHDAQFIAYRTRHIDLLHSAEVTAQLLKWLRPK